MNDTNNLKKHISGPVGGGGNDSPPPLDLGSSL